MACSSFVVSESKHSYMNNNLSFKESSWEIKDVKHLLNQLENDLQDSLDVYICAFDSIFRHATDLLNWKCLEFFIESLITKAKDRVLKSEFNICHFICQFCGDILRDPVTLNCGHTFSKKCALLRSSKSNFQCMVCFSNYSHSYMVQLKNDVHISTVMQKLWKDLVNTTDADHNSHENRCDFYNYFLSIINCELDLKTCITFNENPSPKNFLIKAKLLVNLRRYSDAIYLLLIYSVLVPDTSYDKNEVTHHLYKLLLKYPTESEMTYASKEFSLSTRNILDSSYKNLKTNCSLIITPQELSLVFKRFCDTVKELAKMNFLTTNILQIQDFECSLCLQTFLEPVTTSCGHTFCRRCLLRWFDHKPSCPLCKSHLNSYITEHGKATTKFTLELIKTLFPHIYDERKTLHLKEVREFFYPDKQEHVLPIFICTLAFPNVACPLHVFEPRYKLMIRQCLEAGSSRFGMCAFIDNEISEYGTVLEIKDVSYFPDGRSVVYTVGVGRFRILSKGEHDGYPYATVEYLKDNLISETEDFKKIHNYVYKSAAGWFAGLPQATKLQVLQHFGPMPVLELNLSSNADGPSWYWWILAILPLDQKLKAKILPLVSIRHRLMALQKILLCIEPSVFY